MKTEALETTDWIYNRRSPGSTRLPWHQCVPPSWAHVTCHLNSQCWTPLLKHACNCLKSQMVNSALYCTVSSIHLKHLFLHPVSFRSSCEGLDVLQLPAYFVLICSHCWSKQQKCLFSLNGCLCVLCLNVKHLVCRCHLSLHWASMQHVQSSLHRPDVSTCVHVSSCRRRLSPTCPLMSCTCSEFRQCVSMICGVISVKRCSSEVHSQDLQLAVFWMVCLNPAFWTCSHFSANTTRIFEGSRIVKTGMVSGSAKM